MIQLDVPVVVIEPSFNGTPGLTIVDFITFAGDPVDFTCSQSFLTGGRNLATFLCGRQF
jgi:hypothetical protein